MARYYIVLLLLSGCGVDAGSPAAEGEREG